MTLLKRSLFFAMLIQYQLVISQDTEELNNKILVQYSLQDYIGCIETCNRLITIESNNHDAYLYKAWSKFLLGDPHGAENDITLARVNGVRVKDKALNYLTNEEERRKELLKLFYKREKVYPEFNYRPRYTQKDSLRGALRPERTCYDVTFYNLQVKINPKKRFISGVSNISFNVKESSTRIQIDLFARYKIDSIIWQRQSLKYKRIYDAIFVDFSKNLVVGTNQTVSVYYSGTPSEAPNPPWDGGFVWKKDKKHNYWCGVACEQFGASSWWPNKDHPSDEPDSALLTFTVPDGYDIVSNGRFRSKKPAEAGYTSHTWFVSNPINNYDITFYLGKYTHFCDTMQNKLGKYTLDYYVLPYNLEEAKKCFAQTKEIMKFYEKAFGEFPFMTDKYALVESPYEGMEHQGAIAYGNDFNRSPQNQMYLNKKYDYIIVHETAHEWWGNSVTASDMADIWLQEGFATYAEMMFIENVFGYDEYLKEIKREMTHIYNVWPLVENYNVNENAFASNDCYTKGAVILHNLRCDINNDSLFFKIIKDFALKFEKKIATTSDFVKLVNEYTRSDYGAFFKKYLYEKDLPVLSYTYRKQGDDIILSYKWTDVAKGFEMPFCIVSGNKNFRLVGETTLKETVIKNAKTFHFYNCWIEPNKVEKNSYTYYWTKCLNSNY